MFETARNNISQVKGVGNPRRVVGGTLFKAAVVIVICYAVETGIMHLLALLSLLDSPIAPVLDSLVLLLVMAPFIYLLFIKPMKGELEKKNELIASKEKLHRALLTVSNCNQALVRATDEKQLMEDTCRILTETGGYRMAWIGLAEHDADKTVKPAAYSGHNEGYVETLNITWADTERGRGPTGTAIRTNKPVICRNIGMDPSFEPWRAEAQERGYASSVAIPLTVGGSVIGSLNIYSDKADGFDADEMRLLTVLAADLSFGIRHQRIKDKLEASEKRYRGLVDNALVGVLLSTIGGEIIYANDTLLEMYGFDSLEEFISAGALKRWKNPKDREKMLEKLKSSGNLKSYEAEVLTRTGETRTILFNSVLSDDKLSSIVTDITEQKRAEEALRESREDFRKILQSSSVAMALTDEEQRIVFLNNKFTRIFGYDLADIPTVEEWWPRTYPDPSYREEMKAEWNRRVGAVMREGVEFAPMEGMVVCKDGNRRDITFNFSFIGKHGLTVFHDITERKIAERMMMESERRFRSLAQTASDAIISIDSGGMVTYWNNGAAKMFGYGEGEIMGRDIVLILPERYHALHRAGIARVAAGGAPKVIGTIATLEGVRKGGGEFPIELSLGMWEMDGKPYFTAIIRDITGRKRMEDELITGARELANAQKIAHVGNWELDIRTGKTTWSDELRRIYGLASEEVVPTFDRFMGLVHPEDRKTIEEHLHKIISGEPSRTEFEMRIIRPDGQERNIFGKLEVVTDEGGKPAKIIGVNFDITERKAMEKAALRAEKLASIGTLSAGVAHEILNPLNIIGTIVQVMLMDEWPVRAKENIQEIMAQVRRATKITNNLRKFAHQRKPERTLLDVHSLFDKTVMLLEHDLQLDNIHVQRDFGADLPAIYADEDQMAQVFLNLLSNARDAMRKSRKGIITMKTRTVGNGVEIRFFDDGPGIPADIIGKIFDPFFTTKSPGEGTGLGLSMLLKIIEEHKGSITVESKEGKGATFIIHLPARMKGDRENGA